MSKTKPATPNDYIAQIEEPHRTAIKAIHAMIRKALPKLEPSIQYGMIGYGTYHYKYDSGREGDAPIIAVASRSGYISIYGCGAEIAKGAKQALPKADFGKGCIRFKKPQDIDLKALEKVVKAAAREKVKLLGKTPTSAAASAKV
ncbi:MAG TPA: DUF1801 domain-containing protein [Terriglobales bacterium]|nr:DUF1801 domain-containing protein [Terriglobales bacterium]